MLTKARLHVMSVETTEVIVKVHNDLRRKVAKGEESRGAPGPQPSASNMRKLVSKKIKKMSIRLHHTLLSMNVKTGSKKIHGLLKGRTS